MASLGRDAERPRRLVRADEPAGPGKAISLVGDAGRIEAGGGATDDVALLLGAAAGNWDSIGELYLRHREASMAVAVSVLADPSEGEDVVHEAFIDLPRMARSYDPRRGRPAQWLYRSVRNRAIDHLRHRSRWARRMASSVDGPDALLATAATSAEASPEGRAESAEFVDLITRLEPRHAHLIRLAFLEGWSHTTIAELTGLPLGTVKTRIRHSLGELRQLLAAADVAGSAPSSTAPRLDEGNLLAVTADARFGAALVREAAGLSHVEVQAHIPAHAGVMPDATVLDLEADPAPLAESLQRIDDLGWDRVPVLVRLAGRGPLALPGRLAPTLVTGAQGPVDLRLDAAVPAILSASQDPEVRRHATDRLMQGDESAAVTGDALGRLTGATPAAALFLGMTPRQLAGSYVTDLIGMPARWTEHWWQHLASTGWWAGRVFVRRPDRDSLPVQAAAWMARDEGFVGISKPVQY